MITRQLKFEATWLRVRKRSRQPVIIALYQILG